MNAASDSELVLRGRAGDKGAIAFLLARHRPMALALARRMLGDPGLAEDAVQEAAFQALLNLKRLRRPERFGPWLAGIALNVCRGWRRAQQRDLWSWDAIQGGSLGPEPPDESPGPEEIAEAADISERVRYAVAALPPGQRAAVLLVYLSGMTHAETAAALGIPASAVKARVHKARAALRRRLEGVRGEIEMAEIEREQEQFVDVRVADVRRFMASKRHVIVLEEITGQRRLPIWVGAFEGTAIALALEGVDPPRPLTFPFIARLIEAAGAGLREVRIERLSDETFYAVAVVEGSVGPRATIDARPSDAINLALTVEAPIRVARSVLNAVEAAGEGRPLLPDPYDEGTDGAPRIASEMRAIWREARSWRTGAR